MPNARLMDILVEEADIRGHKPVDLAQHLDIGYVYLTQLIRGKKDPAHLSRQKLASIANYLDVPLIQVYIWSGAIRPEDFVHCGKFKANATSILDKMTAHPDWGGFVPTPAEWKKLPPKIQTLLVFAFEQATGQSLTHKPEILTLPRGGIPKKNNPPAAILSGVTEDQSSILTTSISLPFLRNRSTTSAETAKCFNNAA